MKQKHSLAWAAGVFEGEGCFYLHKREKGMGRVRAFAVMNMTDFDVVKKFKQTVGVGSLFGPYGDYRKQKDGGPRKPMLRWYATAKDAELVAKRLLPWLGNRRTQKINEVLSQVRAYAIQK